MEQSKCPVFREYFDLLDWSFFESQKGIDNWRRIFFNYYCAFYPYFTCFLSKAITICKTSEASEILGDNLHCEINEDHANLLRKVFREIKFFKTSLNRNKCAEITRLTIDTLNLNSPIQIIAFLATLERASMKFIPIMRDRFRIITLLNIMPPGKDDYKYFDVHGEVDILHADQLEEALQNEIDRFVNDGLVEYGGQEKNMIQIGANQACRLLQLIFTP